jgi:hypothetical protein
MKTMHLAWYWHIVKAPKFAPNTSPWSGIDLRIISRVVNIQWSRLIPTSAGLTYSPNPCAKQNMNLYANLLWVGNFVFHLTHYTSSRKRGYSVRNTNLGFVTQFRGIPIFRRISVHKGVSGTEWNGLRFPGPGGPMTKGWNWVTFGS